MKRILAIVAATAGAIGFATPALAHTAYPIDSVNLRTGPGTTYAVIRTLSPSETAAILGRDGSWLKVRTQDGTVGYLADWVTREVYDDEPAYVRIESGPLNVRSGPGIMTAVIGQVAQGARFAALESLAGWYKITVPGTGTGWVSREFASLQVDAAPPPSGGGTQPAPPPPPPGSGLDPNAVVAGLVKEAQSNTTTALYTGRSKEYDEVSVVRVWEKLAYVDSAEGWLKVVNKDGVRGWIAGPEVFLKDRNMDFALQAEYAVRERNWTMVYMRVREVVAGGTGLAMRVGPSRDAALKRNLAEGTRMKLLQVPASEYVEVMLPDGDTGWVSRNWLKPVPGVPGESVSLTEPSPGVLRFEVNGLSGPAVVTPGSTIMTVALPANPSRRAALAVGEAGVSDMVFGENALTLRFDQPFQSRVLEQTDSRVVIEVRPVVSRVERLTGPDRETYRFHTTGVVVPKIARDGDGVVVSLPGARTDGPVAAPEGLTLAADAAGLTGRVVSPRNFAVMAANGYVDLVLYNPGLAGKTILLDPGHGGTETGAVGVTGLLEKEVNLSVSLKLKALLEQAGARVILSRNGDARCASAADLARVVPSEQLRFDLNCRTALSNSSQADLFLSVHSNANPSSAERGTETYWSSDNMNAGRSQVLASLVQQELAAALGIRNRGVKDEIFYVVKFTQAPAALAEMAFLSNSLDEALLKQDTVRQKAAASLFRALQRFFQ